MMEFDDGGGFITRVISNMVTRRMIGLGKQYKRIYFLQTRQNPHLANNFSRSSTLLLPYYSMLIGFKQSRADSSLFTKVQDNSFTAILLC
jgi:hypothetical protein